MEVSVGPPELDVVEHSPVEVLDRGEDQVVVEAQDVERKVVSRFLSVTSLSKLAAYSEDDHSRIEGQVVELLTGVFPFVVNLTGGLLDSFHNIDAYLYGVFLF